MSAPAAAATPDGDGRVNPSEEFLYSRKWPIFGVMMIAWFMTLLDVAIVNIAIPELQKDLSTDIETTSWVANAYNLAFGVVLVGMGRLADQFGRKRLFLLGLGLFTVASAACAAAWTVESLIIFRIFQGIGAGMLAPLGFAMTAMVFPPPQRGRGLALIAVVALVATALGPVIGGVLLEVADWHWIFIINVPVGIVGILLCIRVWPETWDLNAPRQVDYLGMVLLGLGGFCAGYALTEANARGWDDALILFLLQASIFLFAGFFASQRFGRYPMMTHGLMENKQFLGANGAMFVFAMGALWGRCSCSRSSSSASGATSRSRRDWRSCRWRSPGWWCGRSSAGPSTSGSRARSRGPRSCCPRSASSGSRSCPPPPSRRPTTCWSCPGS